MILSKVSADHKVTAAKLSSVDADNGSLLRALAELKDLNAEQQLRAQRGYDDEVAALRRANEKAAAEKAELELSLRERDAHARLGEQKARTYILATFRGMPTANAEG